MEIDSAELEQYIKTSLGAIQKGVESGRFKLYKPVQFTLAVLNVRERSGRVRLVIAEGGEKRSTEELSHITFEATPVETATFNAPRETRRNSAR